MENFGILIPLQESQKCMNERKRALISDLSGIYANFTRIENSALHKLCNVNLCPKVFDLPFTDLSRNLTSRESEEVYRCANILYEEYQYPLVSDVIDYILTSESSSSFIKRLKNETKESIDKLKDKFYLAKISAPEKRKIGPYYQLDLDFHCDEPTCDGGKYRLLIRVLVKDHNGFDYRAIDSKFYTKGSE